MKCSVNNCNLEGIENHHVIYIPEVIKPLCSEHHRKITVINSHEIRKKRNRNKFKGYFGEVKLSNKQRWFLWYRFINNEIKMRISFLDKIFIEEGNLFMAEKIIWMDKHGIVYEKLKTNWITQIKNRKE